MQHSKFRIYKAIIAGGLGIAVAIAIVTNTAIIALAAVIAAIVLDERISQINGKAASASFNIMLIVAALASLGIALFHSQLPENVVFFGAIMGYFICAALLLHLCFYSYFSRKL
jgi:uncharacterized membrane protein